MEDLYKKIIILQELLYDRNELIDCHVDLNDQCFVTIRQLNKVLRKEFKYFKYSWSVRKKYTDAPYSYLFSTFQKSLFTSFYKNDKITLMVSPFECVIGNTHSRRTLRNFLTTRIQNDDFLEYNYLTTDSFEISLNKNKFLFYKTHQFLKKENPDYLECFDNMIIKLL